MAASLSTDTLNTQPSPGSLESPDSPQPLISPRITRIFIFVTLARYVKYERKPQNLRYLKKGNIAKFYLKVHINFKNQTVGRVWECNKDLISPLMILYTPH